MGEKRSSEESTIIYLHAWVSLSSVSPQSQLYHLLHASYVGLFLPIVISMFTLEAHGVLSCVSFRGFLILRRLSLRRLLQKYESWWQPTIECSSKGFKLHSERVSMLCLPDFGSGDVITNPVFLQCFIHIAIPQYSQTTAVFLGSFRITLEEIRSCSHQ